MRKLFALSLLCFALLSSACHRRPDDDASVDGGSGGITNPPSPSPAPQPPSPPPPQPPPPTTSAVEFVPGPFTGLCPLWTKGDREFDGNGPDVLAELRASIMSNGAGVSFYVHLRAVETQSDWTTAEGTWNFVVYRPPSGWQVASIDSASYSSARYIDTNNDMDYPPVSGGLVSQLQIKGDTSGNDVGNCTTDDVYMNVYFNRMRVTIRKF